MTPKIPRLDLSRIRQRFSRHGGFQPFNDESDIETEQSEVKMSNETDAETERRDCETEQSEVKQMVEMNRETNIETEPVEMNQVEQKVKEKATAEITGYIYLSRNPFSLDCPCQRLVAEVTIIEPFESNSPIKIRAWAHYLANKVRINRIFDPRTGRNTRWGCYLSSITAKVTLVGCRSQLTDPRERIPYYLNQNCLLGNVNFSLDNSNFSGLTVRSLSDGRPILKTEYQSGRKLKQIRMVYERGTCQMRQIITFKPNGKYQKVLSIYYRNGKKVKFTKHRNLRKMTKIIEEL